MSLWELLFPPKCPFCRGLLKKEEGKLCDSCRKTLPWTGEKQKEHGSFYSVCVSPLSYRDKARSALLRYKFGGRKAYADCFSDLMAECVKARLNGQPELLTWVPLSRRRQRKRGYSQSRLLAEGIADRLYLPCASTLSKCRHTPAQSGIISAAARRANVSGAFVLRKNADIVGKTILLVDDVFTTGATLSECSRVLLTGGAEKVLCVTLCSASRKN